MVNDTSCTDLLVTGVSFAALIERSTQNRNNNRTANEGPSLFPRFPFLCRDAFHAGQNVTGFSNTFFTGFDAPWQTAFLFPARTKPLSLSPPSISPSFSLLHFPFSPFFWIGSGAFCSISESRAISRGWWSPRRVFRHHFVTFARFYGGCSRERERYALRSMLRIPFRTLYSATRNFFAVYRCRSIESLFPKSSPRWQTSIGIRKEKISPWKIFEHLFVRMENIIKDTSRTSNVARSNVMEVTRVREVNSFVRIFKTSKVDRSYFIR